MTPSDSPTVKRQWFKSIQARLVFAALLLILTTGAGSVYAVWQFSKSAGSIETLILDNIPAIKKSTGLRETAQKIPPLLSKMISAQDMEAYEKSFGEMVAELSHLEEITKSFTKEEHDTTGIDLTRHATVLREEIHALDSFITTFHELVEAEQRVYERIKKDLAVLFEIADQLKGASAVELSLSFVDLANARSISSNQIKRLVDEDFRNFHYSMETEVALTRISAIIDRLAEVDTPFEVDELEDEFVVQIENAKRDIAGLSVEANKELQPLLSKLIGWGAGEFSVFMKRKELQKQKVARDQQLDSTLSSLRLLLVDSGDLSAKVVNDISNVVGAIKKEVDTSIGLTLGMLTIGLMVAGFVGWRIVLHGIARPIQATEAAMRMIADGDVTVTLPPKTDDEIGRMVGALEKLRSHVMGVVKAEKSLRESETRLMAVLEASPVGASIRTVDGDCRFVNSKMLELVGMTKEEFMTSLPRERYASPEERDLIAEKLVKEKQSVHNQEIRLVRKGEGVFWALLTVDLAEIDGQPVHIAWVYDINAGKEAEAKLHEKLDEVESFNKLAVGREIKMISLKEEVNDLHQRMNEPPRYEIVEE